MAGGLLFKLLYRREQTRCRYPTGVGPKRYGMRKKSRRVGCVGLHCAEPEGVEVKWSGYELVE